MPRRRKGWSGITVTDQFCGAGGSTIGAKRAGVEVRLAMNHWDRAVETYNANHPDTDVHCADVSAQDPRRFPSTDILITSPECTTHSPAGGNRRSRQGHDRYSGRTYPWSPTVPYFATELRTRGFRYLGRAA